MTTTHRAIRAARALTDSPRFEIVSPGYIPFWRGGHGTGRCGNVGSVERGGSGRDAPNPPNSREQMPAPIIITPGERFDRLIAIAPARSTRPGQHWLFRCDCGTEVVRHASRVSSGIIHSCGCQHGNTKPGRRRKDGRPSPEYNSWRTIKARCTSPKHRGVRMCEAWFESFDAFLADMGPKPCRSTPSSASILMTSTAPATASGPQPQNHDRNRTQPVFPASMRRDASFER
jgi:hypothetical protein